MKYIFVLFLFSFHEKTPWFHDAIIYQVTPYIFTDSCRFPDIEAKLPELADLGVNTLYLQPVFATHRGKQGYDITDFFSIRADLGTEQQLESLIKKAKSLGFRVLFDMVPNHTSVNHPYAQDVVRNGKNSKYYDYYQHDYDSVMYAEHYHKDSAGLVYYFWKDLVNLNYSNADVQRMMIDACKYWIEKYDIDGYRMDAIWGVNARAPSFSAQLVRELKKLKPDVFLIAEDKATHPFTYSLGYDAGYDWDTSTKWVSKWSWQYEYDEDHSTRIRFSIILLLLKENGCWRSHYLTTAIRSDCGFVFLKTMICTALFPIIRPK
jgi:glycosidase